MNKSPNKFICFSITLAEFWLSPFSGSPDVSPMCAAACHPRGLGTLWAARQPLKKVTSSEGRDTPKEMEGDTMTLVSPPSLGVLPPGVQTPVVSPVGTHTRRGGHNSTEVLRRVSTSGTSGGEDEQRSSRGGGGGGGGIAFPAPKYFPASHARLT